MAESKFGATHDIIDPNDGRCRRVYTIWDMNVETERETNIHHCRILDYIWLRESINAKSKAHDVTVFSGGVIEADVIIATESL